MITTRTARQCGQADYGWSQARYTFSFGHYFDPKLLGYASLRANQEVLAPGRLQPRTYPKVDILNVIWMEKQSIATAKAIMFRPAPERRCCSLPSQVSAIANTISAKTNR